MKDEKNINEIEVEDVEIEDENENVKKQKKKKEKKEKSGKSGIWAFLLGTHVSALGVIIIVVVAALVFFSFKSIFYNDKAEVTSEYISGILTEQSELTTAELNYTGMTEYKDTGIKFINRSDFIMVYHSTAKAGIDMEEVEVDVNNTTKTVHLKIPRAEVIDVKVDVNSIKYFDEDFALLNWNEKEDGNKAIALAEDKARKEVANMGILKMADNQSETLIKGLLQGAIPNDYKFKVEFKEKVDDDAEKADDSSDKE